MLVTCEEFAEKLRQYNEICIVYHEGPDGDCIGSAYGLAEALRTAGCQCAVLGQDPVPEPYQVMTEGWKQDTPVHPVYIGVDCADRARTGKLYQDKEYLFWIDHHGSEQEQAAFELTDPSRSACSELILELIEKMQIPVTANIADMLYSAMITDTNCFRTPSVSSRTFETAARLAAYGADVSAIGRRYRFHKPERRLRLEAAMLAHTHFLYGGRLITSVLHLKDLENAGIASQSDIAMEGINDYPEQFSEMEIGLTLREYPGGEVRASVKTAAGGVDAKEIAEAFGGGGHRHAGGFRICADAEQLRMQMETFCKRYFENDGATDACNCVSIM